MDARYKEVKKLRWLFRIIRFPVKLFDDHAQGILIVLILILAIGFLLGRLKLKI
jgi:hypothetical protein